MEKEYYVARLKTDDTDPNDVSIEELRDLENPVSSVQSIICF